jgi:serine protease Do
MRCSVAALVTLVALGASDLVAAQEFRKERPVASGWTIVERGRDGKLISCLANKAVTSRVLMFVGRQTNGWFVSIGRIGGLGSQGAAAGDPISLVVKGQSVYSGRIVFRSKNLGDLAPPLSDDIIVRIASSNTLRLVAANDIVDYDTTGFRSAILEVIDCEKRAAQRNQTEGSSGTGFYVSADGHVLTNAHVVRGCSTVTLQANTTSHAAAVSASDDKIDLALLKSPAQPDMIPPLRINVRTGEAIAVFGFPLSQILPSTGNFTLGNVTATAGLRDNPNMLQISAPVQSGNSGGPLLDLRGNVVGIVTSKLNALALAAITADIAQNVNFAVKSDVAIRFLAEHGVRQINPILATQMEPADLADAAKRYTVFIRCENRQKPNVSQVEKALSHCGEGCAPDAQKRPLSHDASLPKKPLATRSRCAQLVMKKYVYIYGAAEREPKISACTSSGGKDY